LALTLTYQGHFAEAEPHFQAALAAAEATRQPAKTSSVLTNLGVVYMFSGRFHEGHAAWQRAMVLSTAVGDQNYIVHDTILLGFAALHLGNYAEAIARAREGVASADSLGYVRDGALGQLLLGSAQLAEGQLAAAHSSIDASITRYRTTAHPDELSWAMAVKLYVLRAQGHQTELPALATATLATLRTAEGFNAVQTLLPILALLLYDQGETEQAVELTIALRQSTFISQSAWFTQVMGAALQAQLARLPLATQAELATEVAIGRQRNGAELLRQISLSSAT
jgi:tetratricopeptide (TPR) repeat protein